MKTMNFVKLRFAVWLMGGSVQACANENVVSFFDVKSLYDAAYEEKAKARAVLKDFRAKLNEARQLDAAYRGQMDVKRLQQFQKVA